ncbi:macrolide resistance MFS transporter Mrx(A) [Actinoallomurus vinaceus]|uniref:Macrolide resistance MFS transporter Mrx(A) n=1 Tax=Actinoallomurus vinaceus TaxID=1080074 RepID=A0ABP8UP00_9ACTN
MTGEVPDVAGVSGKRTVRPLAGLLTAIAVSLTGTRVSAIALPWFVLITTGSATRTGLVAFCEMTPYVLVKALTGPLVDRAGPRAVSWTTDLASAGAVGAIPLLHSSGLLTFPVLLGLVALIGSARGPGDLAKEVMIPDAAERSRVPTERATGLSGATERLASTIGPAAGGALVALLGPLTGLVLNTCCFALGSVITALVLPRGMGGATEKAGSAQAEPGYWRSFGEGFAFLRGEPLLLTIVIMVGITNLLDSAFNAVLRPVWAKDSGNGAAAIGLTSSALAVTALAGSLCAAAIAHRMRRRLVFFAGFTIAGAPPFLILASTAPMWVIVPVFAISGFGAGFLNPIIGAISFERVPRHLLGRVRALGDSVAWAGIPLGGLIGGAAVASWGLVPVLLAGGAAYFLTTSLAGLRPEWREMDRRRGRTGSENALRSSAQ